jgi:hypothetical protein
MPYRRVRPCVRGLIRLVARAAAANAGAVGTGICATRSNRTRSGCATPICLASASCGSLSATPDRRIARSCPTAQAHARGNSISSCSGVIMLTVGAVGFIDSLGLSRFELRLHLGIYFPFHRGNNALKRCTRASRVFGQVNLKTKEQARN